MITRTIHTQAHNIKFSNFETGARREANLFYSSFCYVVTDARGRELARVADGQTSTRPQTFAQVCDITRARAIVASLAN